MDVLAGLDPFDLMDAEAARLDAFFAALPAAEWSGATACAGWDRHDLLAHLAASEEYNHACLDDALPALFERFAARGIGGVHDFNAAGVEDRRGRPPTEVLAEWRIANGRTRDELRARRDGDLTTMVGPYRVRLQAFHLAAELATHADDVGVPSAPDEVPARQAWRARVAKFMLDEERPDNGVDALDGGWSVPRPDGTRLVVDDTAFAAAVNGRGGGLDPAVAASLDLMP